MSTSIESRLRDHFASVDAVVVADPDTVRVGARTRRRRLDRRRRSAVVVVSALLIVGGVAVVGRYRTDRSVATLSNAASTTVLAAGAGPSTATVRSSAPPPSSTIAAPGPSTTVLGDGFRPLSGDPRGPAALPSVVWTGDEAIVTGGLDATGDPVDGTVGYQPSTNTWRMLADGPLVAQGINPLVAWTGQAMLVIGGDNPNGSLLVSAGSSYQPSTDSWRVIASPPVGFVSDRSPSAWTGSELLVWPSDGGGSSMPIAPIAPIAYDPTSDTWHELPEPPVARRQQAASVWTGTEWIVWGGTTGASVLADGAAYNPTTNTWRTLAAAPLSGRRVAGVWTGSEMLVTAGASGGAGPNNNGEFAFADGAAYSPATDTWRRLTDGPAHPAFVPVWTGSELVLFAKGGVSVYDPATDRWLSGCCDGDAAYADGSPVWTGEQILIIGSSTSTTGGAAFTPPHT